MTCIPADVALHCVICFEEFSLRGRHPVVLPCGHTYVCNVCSKRLKRCMECRQPLFWTPPSAKPAFPALNINGRSPATARYGGPRGRYSPGPHTPPHPSVATPPVKEEPVPLPLPKNIVLMEMIEAAERQSRYLLEAKGMAGALIDNSASEDEEEDQPRPEPIISSASAVVGTCGTYAVRDPLGLAVLPFDPNKQHQISDKKHPAEEEKKAEELREPFTIEAGQTVQVVSADEGVYKLARGEGYVVATVNQLVKVGGPLEKSCQLEGMLESVQAKQRQLQKELEDVQYLSGALQDQVKTEQALQANHPVICAQKDIEGFGINDENDNSFVRAPGTPTRKFAAKPTSPGGLRLTASTDSTAVELGDPHTPATDPQSNVMLHSPAHSCPMPSETHLEQPYMDGKRTGLPRYRVNTDDDLHGLPWGFGCGAALFGERLIGQGADNMLSLSFDDSLVEDTPNRVPVVDTRAIGIQALEASELFRSPIRSESFDGVNFRTGMSGHRGLSQARKKTSPMARPEVRMMSEHRGVAAGRAAPIRRRTTPNGIHFAD